MTLGPVSQRLLVRLAAGGGAMVTREALLFAMYGDDPDGGPASAQDVLEALVGRLRRRGYPIGLHWGQGYSLDPAHPLPAALRIPADDLHVVLARTEAEADEMRRRLAAEP